MSRETRHQRLTEIFQNIEFFPTGLAATHERAFTIATGYIHAWFGGKRDEQPHENCHCC